MGLSFDCPRCLSASKHPRIHRLVMWFVARVRSEDKTMSGVTRRLYDFEGTRFSELTLWREQPQPRDPLIQLEHWRGYVERGTVYDMLRFTEL